MCKGVSVEAGESGMWSDRVRYASKKQRLDTVSDLPPSGAHLQQYCKLHEQHEIQYELKRIAETVPKELDRVEKLRRAKYDPYSYVHEHFGKLLSEIYIREEEVVELVHKHFDSLIDQVKKIRDS